MKNTLREYALEQCARLSVLRWFPTLPTAVSELVDALESAGSPEVIRSIVDDILSDLEFVECPQPSVIRRMADSRRPRQAKSIYSPRGCSNCTYGWIEIDIGEGYMGVKPCPCQVLKT